MRIEEAQSEYVNLHGNVKGEGLGLEKGLLDRARKAPPRGVLALRVVR
jgi:hypothetical protein